MDERSTEEFLVRFYRWSMNDAMREIKEDFPLIRSIRGIAAGEFLESIEPLEEQERFELIRALVKRFHPQALAICGESLSKHEEELIQSHLSASAEVRSGYVDKLVFTMNRKPSKRKLRVVVKEQLVSVCGPVVRRDSNDLWDHAMIIEAWTVFTGIDLGGSGRLRYGHYIQNGSPGSLTGGSISILRWMGISGGTTEWNLLCEGDEENGVKSLATICSHFIDALPLMLKGIR